MHVFLQAKTMAGAEGKKLWTAHSPEPQLLTIYTTSSLVALGTPGSRVIQMERLVPAG